MPKGTIITTFDSSFSVLYPILYNKCWISLCYRICYGVTCQDFLLTAANCFLVCYVFAWKTDVWLYFMWVWCVVKTKNFCFEIRFDLRILKRLTLYDDRIFMLVVMRQLRHTGTGKIQVGTEQRIATGVGEIFPDLIWGTAWLHLRYCSGITWGNVLTSFEVMFCFNLRYCSCPIWSNVQTSFEVLFWYYLR